LIPQAPGLLPYTSKRYKCQEVTQLRHIFQLYLW